MRLTKWGNGKFDKPQKAYVAILVATYPEEGKVSWRWITSLWRNGHKEWNCDNHKQALLWSNKRHAEEIISLLSWHGVAAYEVTVLPDSIPENNW